MGHNPKSFSYDFKNWQCSNSYSDEKIVDRPFVVIRSHGGWAGVKAMRRAKVFEKADERILGDGNFVEKVLAGR